MNRTELVDAVAAAANIEKRAADEALSAVVDTITKAVAGRDKVTIAGFGTFEARDRAARQGRNPQTGETIQIAASTAPAFKPASAFKDAVDKK